MLATALPATGLRQAASDGQSAPWSVVSYLDDAGLHERGIFVVDFDADGTVWIAASDGLHRYDGYRWKRFGSEHGFPSDFVRCITVARDGTRWVGTDRGAGTFDGERFIALEAEGELAGPSVRRNYEDSAGAVWFCCDGSLSVPRGGVLIDWRMHEQGSVVHLRWVETDGPPVAPPTHRGFGTTMLEGGIAYELGGEVSLSFRPEGLRCGISFPLRAEPR